MTVAELIEELKKCDPDKKVLGEGCDCINSITRVDPEPVGLEDRVLLEVQP